MDCNHGNSGEHQRLWPMIWNIHTWSTYQTHSSSKPKTKLVEDRRKEPWLPYGTRQNKHQEFVATKHSHGPVPFPVTHRNGLLHKWNTSETLNETTETTPGIFFQGLQCDALHEPGLCFKDIKVASLKATTVRIPRALLFQLPDE